MKTQVLLVIMLFSFLLQGCSSIVKGTKQDVTVTSNVVGAEVSVNGVVIGKTPITASIKREDKITIILKKEGYKDYSQTFKTSLEPWFWGNLVFGGVFGSTTDSVSGSIHRLDPDSIFVHMQEAGSLSDVTNQSSDKETEIRSFVATSYSDLLKGINAKEGEHLKSLYKLLGTKSNDEHKTHEQLVVIMNNHKTVNDFSNEVVKLYSQQN